jgi:translation initiation factor IF-1
MAKEEPIVLTGVIIELLPAGTFRIKLPNEKIVLGHLSGKIRQHAIKVLLGDSVSIEFSPYDLTKGRIVRRL